MRYAKLFFGLRKRSVGNRGGGTFINYNCFFDLGDDIVIGKNCNLAYNVTIMNSSHKIGTSKRRASENITAPTKIGNGVWIGANSVIFPGVTIGDGVIIGAGSLVTKDCEPDCLYAGHPAIKVRGLSKNEY